MPTCQKRWRSGPTLLLTLLLTGCGGAPPSPLPAPSPPSASPAGLPEPVRCPAPTVTVSTAEQLHAALAGARAGDVIGVADGAYSGNFVATAQGAPESPVFLCGGPGAVLDAGGIKEGYVLHLDGATWWRVVGLTVRNGQKGVMADAAQHLVLQGLTVERTGDEAVHLRRGSSDNVVRDSAIRDTGHRRAKFGEGVYVGTATSNWCTISDCQPDRSDRNLVLGNTITATSAEAVDLKEGTSDGVVHGNRFDGADLTGADSWLDAKGNDWRVTGNSGVGSPADGFQTHQVARGWGHRTAFSGNTGSGLAREDPEGVLVGLHPGPDATVSCDNRVLDGSAPLTNGDCR